jgi:hypothetical protein
MANQHHPADSGRRPLTGILEKMPTCEGLCSWVFDLAEGRFRLKILHPHCQLHRGVPTDLDEPPSLEEWLGATA